jgi:hypothetical protein
MDSVGDWKALNSLRRSSTQSRTRGSDFLTGGRAFLFAPATLIKKLLRRLGPDEFPSHLDRAIDSEAVAFSFSDLLDVF